MPAPSLHLNDRQEPYSIAFIGSIVATAGYSFQAFNSATNPDRVSIDAQISIPEIKDVLIQDLKVQAKCTYYHQPKEGYLPFKINKKNYDDIRLNRNPHLLLVVNIPKSNNEWVLSNDRSLELRYNCYYLSLVGLDEIAGDSKTLRIPLGNVLTPGRLSEIMDLLSEGKFIKHNNDVIDLVS